MQDHHPTYCETEATLGISSISINKILHEHLSVKNIFSPWISHNLTKTQKDARVDLCKQIVGYMWKQARNKRDTDCI